MLSEFNGLRDCVVGNQALSPPKYTPVPTTDLRSGICTTEAGPVKRRLKQQRKSDTRITRPLSTERKSNAQITEEVRAPAQKKKKNKAT